MAKDRSSETVHPSSRGPYPRRGADGRATNKHRLERDELGRWACMLCKRWATGEASKKALLSKPCEEIEVR